MKFFTRLLTTLVTRHPKTVLCFGVLTSCVLLWHASVTLRFDTDQDHLMSDSEKYYQDYKNFLKEFGDWEYIYVVIKTPATSDGAFLAKKFSKKLSARLESRPDLYNEITTHVDTTKLKNSLLLLADQPTFDHFAKFAGNHEKTFKQFLSVASLSDWYAWINSLFALARAENNRASIEQFWPLIKNAISGPFDEQALSELNNRSWTSFFAGRVVDPEGYLFSENGKILFVRILPKKDFSRLDIIQEPLAFLRQTIAELKPSFTALEVGVTGRPVLQNDEADSTQVDSLLAGIGSFLLVALLIFAGFRELRRPFFALLALMIGMAWTTGFASLFFGQLNLITIAFVIILIGLGIEYGIHFLSRYLWERKEGHETTAAISKTLEHTGRAIGIGGITAAAAFLTAIFTHFKGLQQLGIIAGAGVIFCFLAEVTILPSLLMLFDTHKQTNKTIPANKQVRFDFLVKHPKPTIIVLSVFTLIGLIVAPSLHFDSNLLNLQDQKLESLVFEKIIQDNTEQSTWFLTYHTKDLNDLYDKQTRVAQLSSVKKTDSLFQLVPQNQKERLLQLQDLQKKLQHSHVPASPQNLPQQVDLLKTQVATLTNQAFKNGMIEEFNELNSLNDTLGKQSDTLRAAKRVPFENNFLTFVNRLQGELHSLLTPSLVTEAELPSKLLSLYKSANGSYSLTIYPHKDIWDPQNQEEFINQVRTIIPDVTGAPVTTYESAKRLVSGFLLVALLTSLIILFAIWAEFREIRASLFVFGNLVISLIWLVGYLYIRDLSINLANFFALPIIIGTGVDNAVHVYHRIRETGSVPGTLNAVSPAIIMSCLTTAAGFVSLSFVRHRGLASFGELISVGTLFILISSLVLLPNIMALCSQNKSSSV